MRLPCSLAVLLSVATTAAADDRLTVHLFQYGSANTPEKKSAFLDFKDLMADKMPRLASELLDAGDLASVSGLKLELVPSTQGDGLATTSERIPSLEDRRIYWRDTGALALLTGRVTQEPGQPFAIRSTVFWGELGSLAGRESIDLELPFTSTTYDTTNDSHSVAFLYSLAIEIGEDCSKRGDAFFLLSQAQLRADAVMADAPVLGEELRLLVDAAAADLESRCA